MSAERHNRGFYSLSYVNIKPCRKTIIMPPPIIGGALSDAFVWRLTSPVAYIGLKSRTERPRKTKIGTEVAHVTRDSDITFRVKRSKVKGQRHQFTQRGLNA